MFTTELLTFIRRIPETVVLTKEGTTWQKRYWEHWRILKDPRTYVVANPAEKKISDGLAPTDFAAYVGAPSGESLDDMTFKAGNGEYSFANQKRYYSTFKGPEPAVQIGYAELCFTIAEAINRGWATGDAAAYYKNGITASMKFYGIEDGAEIEITEPDCR